MSNTVIMDSKLETPAAGFDKVKLWGAGLLVAAAMGAFYYFADQSLLLRVVGLLAAVVVAAFIALQTEPGRQFAAFMKEAQIEVRKVVWPTRDETLKTTAIVAVVVIVMGLFLWMLDALIAWVVQWLTISGA
jgi:preprotein translocase subunit SecE